MDLSKLNPQQRQAVRTVAGPLLLLAGAGTGKTRVITFRIAFLIRSGIAPENILAVTFTNKAAREMRERLGQLLTEEAAQQVTVGTFHAFCARLLRHHIHQLGYTNNFSIASESYQSGLVRTLMAELGLTGEGRDPRDWLAAISGAKTKMLEPDEFAAHSSHQYAQQIAEVYELYQRRLMQMNLVDFDDLLLLVLRLWQERPERLAEHREQFQYLLIDECQDTNAVQFQLMATLAGPRQNICAVGDDDQSIYGWRGADISNILQFDSQYPKAKVIRLEQNYRSTTTILNAANHVIANNRSRHAKKLWSAKGEGARILAVRTESDREETRAVIDLVRERHLRDARPYSDFAVLFRSNHLSRALENGFRQAKIPHTMVGTRSFFQRKEILDAVSLLQTALNPRDDLSLLRILNVPPRGVGDKAVERLREWQRITGLPLQRLITSSEYLKQISDSAGTSLRQLHGCLGRAREQFRSPGGLADKVKALLQDSGYMGGLGRMYKPRSDALVRLENVHEFVAEVAEFEERNGPKTTVAEFLESFALLDANDREEQTGAQDEGAVTLMTVHAAKGLEFPVVFVTGLERGLFPHIRAIEDNAEDEERRLFYVALTRAQEEVVLTHADRRRTRNQIKKQRPSPFLDELPEDLVRFCGAADALVPATREMASDYLAQMKAMFAPKK